MHRVAVKFNAPQVAAFKRIKPGTTSALMWGRGTGKSHFLRTACWLLVSQYDGRPRGSALKTIEGVRIVFPMPTLKQFKDVHAAAIEADLLGSDAPWGFLGAKLDRVTWKIRFPGGSWVQPFPASEHNARTSRGVRCDVALFDECDDIDPGVFHGVSLPWFSEPFSLNIKIASGTPRRGRHGLLYELFRLGQASDPELARFWSSHATYADCPDTVSADTVAEAKATTPPEIFKREWEADPDSAEGLVYDLFDESYHIRVPHYEQHFSDLIVGVDHGYADPGVYLLIGIMGKGRDATAWVLDEIYQTGKAPSWWVERAKEWNKGQRFFCDRSRPDIIDEMRRAGIAAVPAANEIDAGVARVADMLFRKGDAQAANLFVHPKCENTIREMRSYRRKRDPQNADRYLDQIEDRNNHAMDALRYALYMRFGKPPSYRGGRALS